MAEMIDWRKLGLMLPLQEHQLRRKLAKSFEYECRNVSNREWFLGVLWSPYLKSGRVHQKLAQADREIGIGHTVRIVASIGMD